MTHSWPRLRKVSRSGQALDGDELVVEAPDGVARRPAEALDMPVEHGATPGLAVSDLADQRRAAHCLSGLAERRCRTDAGALSFQKQVEQINRFRRGHVAEIGRICLVHLAGRRIGLRRFRIPAVRLAAHFTCLSNKTGIYYTSFRPTGRSRQRCI
jgi:hypothetical protein